MQTLARVVHKFLGGHGRFVSARVGLESYKQQWAVLPKQLRMGYSSRKFYESPQYGAKDRRSFTKQGNRDKSYNDILQTGTRLAGESANTETRPKKPVYDILNCGSRSRFVVCGDNAPFIVHNCCQALARIVIGDQLIMIAKKYPVVMTVHDAVACLVRKKDIWDGLQFVDSCMKFTPSWAEGLPLSCELGYGLSYADAGNKKSITLHKHDF